jgi:tetratricopeptide (TPR) repeat protein
MRFNPMLMCAVVLFAPAPAMAGDKVLQGKAPDWVTQATLDPASAKGKPSQLIADYQYRIEKGEVFSYVDNAFRIDDPDTLMAQNTVSLTWLPDKGDLKIHHLEIYRDGKVIDLLANGAKFDVIRREPGLESRLLDGELTATLSVPGLRVGDILRTTYTISTHDQALGNEAQVLQALGSEPWRVDMGRAIVSWPQDEQMYWKAEAKAGVKDPELRNGYRYLTVKLPLAEPKEMPKDAPWRYQRPSVLRVGTYPSWKDLSKQMAPYYAAASDVAAGGAVAKQAAAIMQKSNDPLTRAALATRLVQDQVSYLLNGLNGGNYLPQRAEFTWDKRYGDCKAKSVLLLALLKQMGIEAEPALVASSGGDALPEILPIPGDFDHVIVHARISGTDYWLDGTSTGTRLANVADVPPFHYALPLRAGGSDLMPMTTRDETQPDLTITGRMDHSAGVDFPQLFTITVQGYGASGAAVESMADANDPKLLRRLAGTFAEQGGIGQGAVSSIRVSYDKENAIGRMVIEGIASPSFKWQDGKFVVDTGGPTDGIDFNPDRARPEWRDIPVATQGPSYVRIDFSMALPEHGKGFSLSGPERLETRFANTRIIATGKLAEGMIRGGAEIWQTLGEIAPADVAEAKRQARRIKAELAKLVAPTTVTWRWDLDEKQRQAKAAPILAAYDKAIAFALEDDFNPLVQKAQFLQGIYDYPAALAAYNQLIDKSPSAWAHLQRSSVLLALGRRPDAIADLKSAYDLEPANGTAFELAKELAYDGKADDAQKLLESLAVQEDERAGFADAQATVEGLKGDSKDALTVLADAIADKPENSDVLNSDCWFRGLFNVALDTAVSECTHAVERASSPAAALDSRALVEFRLGNYDAALADLNSVLKLAPAIPASRFMRGVVRLKKGDDQGREDIQAALRMSPSLATFYARHGIAPIT